MISAEQKKFRKNVSILALCQALFMSGTSMFVTVSALVGFTLAEDQTYASLPFAMQLMATMLTSIPAAILMSRIGRKKSFLISTLIACFGAVISGYAILHSSFGLFVFGSLMLGIFSGFANYYRFTAADSVSTIYKSRAISLVLAGGVIAAFIGPNLANYTRDIFHAAMFAGSYFSITLLYILSFILLSWLDVEDQDRPRLNASTGRPLMQIASQPAFITAVTCGMLGYALMTFIMTATPLAMHHHQHDFPDTSFVIQWHVLGMFVPSFFTGHLIKKFGVIKIMFSGVLLGLGCIFINLNGTSVSHFWLALLLLGISWNFLFIGATTLLTETYTPEEKFKAQGLNDFLVFTTVSMASLFAGIIHHNVGWQVINYASLPVLLIITISLVMIYRQHQSAIISPDTEVLENATNSAEG